MTINSLPQNNSSFSQDLNTFLSEEDADRFKSIWVSHVISGGTHGTGASLTQSPASLTAFPGGHYVTETGSITYPDDATHIWVICHKDTTSAITNWTRVTATHYLFWSTGSATPPTLPVDAAFLMKVTTASGSVTVVDDNRLLSGIGSHVRTRAPTATDDVNLQYFPGDYWINSTDGTYFVMTDNTAGAAVWANTLAFSDAQIKVAYENNANTNEFDDAEQTKLAATLIEDDVIGLIIALG